MTGRSDDRVAARRAGRTRPKGRSRRRAADRGRSGRLPGGDPGVGGREHRRPRLRRPRPRAHPRPRGRPGPLRVLQRATSGPASRCSSALTGWGRRWPWRCCRSIRRSALRHAVATDDVDALMLVPGIGKKTAARLIIELKTRLDVDDDAILATPLSRDGDAGIDGSVRRREVRAALPGPRLRSRRDPGHGPASARRGHGRGPGPRRPPGTGRIPMTPPPPAPRPRIGL